MADAPGIPISGTAAYWARVYYGVTVPLIVLCLATIGIRMRRRINGGLALDDWLILFGIVRCLPLLFPHAYGRAELRSCSAGRSVTYSG